MNYIEALQALVDGKKIREKNWNKGEYVYIEDNPIVTDCGDVIDLVVDDLEDITKDNWEIYQTKEDKLIQAGKRWKIWKTCCSSNGCGNCESKNKELYRFCQYKVGTFNEIITNATDDEVDKLYNAVKGEIDA